MKIAVQHPGDAAPTSGKTREQPFRVGGRWRIETVFENVSRFYPDEGFLVVEFSDDTESVSWELDDAEVIESAEDSASLLYGEPENEEDEEEAIAAEGGTTKAK